MEKKTLVVLLVLALFIFACSEPKVTGRKLSPTGAAVKVHEAPVSDPIEAEQTAAEALEEVKQQWDDVPAPVDTTKEGVSLYPPVVTSKTGEDALKERTKAAFSKGSGVSEDVDADKVFGSKYHSSSGSATNLPEGYGEGNSWD